MSSVANWINAAFGMSAWSFGFLLATVLTVVVVALLLGIIQQARRILGLAKTASTVVAEIDTNTRSVWALRDTNAVAGQILEGAKAIEGNAGGIVGAVAASHQKTAA
jgi:hypothetical protein